MFSNSGDGIELIGLLHGGNKMSTSNLLIRASAKLYMQKLVQNTSTCHATCMRREFVLFFNM